MKDLTVGKPRSVLVAYTLPLFGSIIFQQLYNIADSFVAGRYIGTEALAAVGNSYEITLIYIALAFGCNIGTSVVTARLFGEKKYGDVRTCVHTALIFSALFGISLTFVGMLCSDWLLRIINTPEEVMADSKTYLDIYLWGYIFLLLYQVATGIFSALGDSQTPFWFLAVSSVSNIFVDILFVRNFGMGVEGVAYATFLCQSISGIAAVAFVLMKVRKLERGNSRAFSFPLLKRILAIAAPSAVQQSCISVGNILVQSVVNGFGTAAIGGYAAAVKLNNMTITSITALGNGMSNYTSQNYGAGKYERIHQGTVSGWGLGVGFALAFTAVYQLLCHQLVGLFITDGNQEAYQVGMMFLRVVSPFYTVIAFKLILDGVLRGMGKMGAFMLSTMTDLVLRVVLAFVAAPIFGTTGIWSIWPVGWAVALVISGVMYAKYRRQLGAAK